MGRFTTGGIARDVMAGALAGAAAVWLVEKMELNLTHAGADGDTDPAHQAAAKAQNRTGVNLGGDPAHNPAGRGIHFGVGAGLGALYGLLRGMAPSVTAGRGALYGMGAFLLGDEIGAPSLGLAKGPFEYSARAHGRAALAHGVFGVLTDLGTRLIAPWKDEVVLYRGPSLSERVAGGRHVLEDWRDRGLTALDQGRERLGQWTDDLRERAEAADLPGLVERGRRYAGGVASQARDWLPDRDDVAGYADRAQRRARRFARENLPDRDDVDDMVEAGRRRLLRAGTRARDSLPDRDDVQDLADRGRRLANDAVQGSGLSRAIRWLFG